MADLAAVGAGQPAQHRRELRGAPPPLGVGQRRELGDGRAERVWAAAGVQIALRGGDDVQRAGLALRAGLAPGGDAVTAQDDADGLRVVAVHGGDVQAELEAGPPPRHPGDAVAEAVAGQPLAVGGRGERDPRVGMQVIDVRGLDKTVHGGVDRRRGAALAVQAEVERGDHLVLAVDTGIDVLQRAQPVQPEHREPGGGQRAQVAARALDPHQLRRRGGHRVGHDALGRGVAAGVVGVARVGAQPVAAPDQLGDLGGYLGVHR